MRHWRHFTRDRSVPRNRSLMMDWDRVGGPVKGPSINHDRDPEGPPGVTAGVTKAPTRASAAQQRMNTHAPTRQLTHSEHTRGQCAQLTAHAPLASVSPPGAPGPDGGGVGADAMEAVVDAVPTEALDAAGRLGPTANGWLGCEGVYRCCKGTSVAGTSTASRSCKSDSMTRMTSWASCWP